MHLLKFSIFIIFFALSINLTFGITNTIPEKDYSLKYYMKDSLESKMVDSVKLEIIPDTFLKNNCPDYVDFKITNYSHDSLIMIVEPIIITYNNLLGHGYFDIGYVPFKIKPTILYFFENNTKPFWLGSGYYPIYFNRIHKMLLIPPNTSTTIKILIYNDYRDIINNYECKLVGSAVFFFKKHVDSLIQKYFSEFSDEYFNSILSENEITVNGITLDSLKEIPDFHGFSYDVCECLFSKTVRIALEYKRFCFESLLNKSPKFVIWNY